MQKSIINKKNDKKEHANNLPRGRQLYVNRRVELNNAKLKAKEKLGVFV